MQIAFFLPQNLTRTKNISFIYICCSTFFVHRDPTGGALSSFPTMQRQLNRIKNCLTPDAPKNAADVARVFAMPEIMDRYGKTRGEPKEAFYVGSISHQSFGMAIFASPSIVAKLPTLKNKRFMIDGTFRVVPHGEFCQLLVLHLERKNRVCRIQIYFEKHHVFVVV